MGKNRKLFLVDYCLTPHEKIPSAGILCESDRIIGVGGASAFSTSDTGLEVINMEGSYALPGFIDSHVHGLAGFDASFVEKSPKTINDASKVFAKHGITTFLPTVVSRPKDEMIRNADLLAAQLEKGCQYADATHIHVEGPFINPEKRGSQDMDGICTKIDFGFTKELIAACRNRMKIMSFAPELEGSEKLVELMLENGIIPSMGHSMANEEQTIRAIDAGAARCTYIFNAMPALHQRESTLTTVALTDDRVAIEAIIDGAHLHPRIVNLICRCKPVNKIIAVSNAISAEKALGTKETTATTGEKTTVVTTDSGVIAGSSMTLEHSWFLLRSYANMQETFAAECMTGNPAQNLGLITRGELRPGLRADITFFNTATNRVRTTIVKGKIVYDSEQENNEN